MKFKKLFSDVRSSCDSGSMTAEVFGSALRKGAKSTFRGPTDAFGPNSDDVPKRFRNEGAEGRADFIVWANLPTVGYSVEPNKLYNMRKVRQSLENNKCFVVDTIEKQATAGVKYPMSFYGGVAMGGAALLYILFRRP